MTKQMRLSAAIENLTRALGVAYGGNIHSGCTVVLKEDLRRLLEGRKE